LRPGDDHHSQDQQATCCCQRAAGGRCRHGRPDCSTPAAMKAVAAARRLGPGCLLRSCRRVSCVYTHV
jgi:hypothetical protein